ncbi:MAG: ribonuclease J [Proteobacteria bacterium]|nr:ribonuclease J [Pseudomonadota bacterium]
MKKHFKIIPLGGIGKIGFRNCTIYENEDSIIVIDMGMAFSDASTPGIDYTIVDTKYLEKNIKKVKAIVITHAHYDHIGGLVHMWKKVPAPLHITPFGLEIVKSFFAYKKAKFPGEIVNAEYGKTYTVSKNFSFEFVQMVHSIPQTAGIYIKINGKTIFHNGDFKFDETPILPEYTDHKRLKEISEEGLDLLLADSTSVFSKGEGMSENEVKEHTLKLFQEAKKAIGICCFASNVSRILMTLQLAELVDRKVVMFGSLQNTTLAAAKSGVISEDLIKKVVRKLHDVENLSREKLILFATGSQGEPMAAMSRLARDEMPKVRLLEGDTVIHSAKAVPGNETNVWNMFELLAERGIKIKALFNGHKVHASGHATSVDLLRLFDILKPKVIIPIHGTTQHMQEVTNLVEDNSKSIPCTIAYREFLTIADDNVLEVHSFDDDKLLKETTEFAIDGGKEVAFEDYFIFRQRKFMNEEGAVFIAIAINRNGQVLGQPSISSKGLGDEKKLKDVYQYALANIYKKLKASNMDKHIKDKDKAREAIRIAGRRAFVQHRGKKPMTVVDFIEV